jgi:hypothetical protein
MLLPIRTAPEDIEAICGYLLTKPAGVSPSELINHKRLDGRKVSALKFWGLVEDAAGKLALSPRGRLVAADGGAQKARALREILVAMPPYASTIARAVERNEPIMLASDIAGHWQQDFRGYLHFHAGVLNHQIVGGGARAPGGRPQGQGDAVRARRRGSRSLRARRGRRPQDGSRSAGRR